jgi:hypothetical protein
MKNNYGDLDNALNIESKIIEVEKTPTEIEILVSKPDDIKSGARFEDRSGARRGFVLLS